MSDIDRRVGLKHRLMQQATAIMMQQREQEEAYEAAIQDATAFVDEWDAKLWQLQEDLIAEQGLADAMANLMVKPTAAPTNAVPSPPAESGKKYKWATSLDSQFTFDFKSAVPHRSINEIDWGENILGVQRSEGGAEGVFFVDSTEGALVVKGSRSIASEVFAALLAFKLGIVGPRFRIVPTLSVEGCKLVRRLKALDPAGHIMIRLENQMHLLLKSYVIGTSVSQTTPERAQAIFGPEGNLSDNGKARLRELGRLIVLDLLGNNGDRFPVVWDNRGNPGNVMFDAKSGTVIAIDSQITPIDRSMYEEQFQAYLDKVAKVLDDVIEATRRDDPVVCPSFDVIRQKLLEYTRYNIGEAGVIEVQLGFIDVIARSESLGITPSVLHEWKHLLLKFDPPLVGRESVDLHFINSVWKLFTSRRV